SRKHTDLKADILEGHLSSALCHLANISYRLGEKASVQQIGETLDVASIHPEAREDLERTRHYLAEAKVDLDATPLTLGRHLSLDGDKEAFRNDEVANALL